jgi:hypothetical protein
MESCSSRQKVLVLDCCYSGAFPAGRVSKADSEVHTLEKFQGKGRVVLTASDATQYSFEGNHIIGQGTQSVFTRFLVEGLATGGADLDGDGDISLDELYSYVHDRVIEDMPRQRPKKLENVEGRIVIARNIHWRLPVSVRNAIESPFIQDRLAVLKGLADLHRVGNDLVRAEVTKQTRRLIHDNDKPVSAAALKLMTALDPKQAQRDAEEQAQRDAEEQAQRDAEEQAQRDAEEQAQRDAEEQAQREAPAPIATKPGRLRWRFQTDGRIEWSPLVAGDTIYFSSTDQHLYALDATTGGLRWAYQAAGKALSALTAVGDSIYRQ